MNMSERLVIEVVVKNILLVVLLVLSFGPVKTAVYAAGMANVDSILLFAGMTLVAALFGNFAFTYEFSHVKDKSERLLAHSTTFLLMLVIGLLLEVSFTAISLKADSLSFIFALISVIIYIASVFYDFWDMHRAKI